MNITIVLGPFLTMPPASCGAVERIWHDLAQEFLQHGHTVTVLCQGQKHQASDDVINGIRHIRRLHLQRTGSIGVDLLKDLIYSLTMLRALPRGDVCVTNSFCFPILAARIKHKIGKVVVAVHRYPKQQMRLYASCDRLATVSNAVAKAISTQTPQVHNLVKVISNPIDTRIFKPPTQGRSAQGTQRLLYTGRIHPEKGLHILIQAFRSLTHDFPKLKLVLIGPTTRKEGGGGSSYLNRLTALGRNLPIEFHMPISNKHILAQRLQEAHYYCYPSLAEHGESFGVAPLEAMATGLVPVVSSLDCFRDFITEDQSGLFFDHRSKSPAQALAAVLRKLMAQPDCARQMAMHAVNKAKEFSCQAIAEQYLHDWARLTQTSDHCIAA